jgi:tRNA threonylcarbamoyladenosine biosynthesis protein TsaE
VETLQSASEEHTTEIGRRLAAGLCGGDVVLLHGDLGAGKTALVKGLAEGLGIDRDQVSSPTFTLIQEYRGGRLTLYHVDLYRLDDPREVADLGLEEIAAGGVLAIEWAEKLGGALPKRRAEIGQGSTAATDRQSRRTVIRLEHGDGDARTITIDEV